MLEWVDKQNGVDDILAEDVNMLAHAIKYSENEIDRLDVQMGNIGTALDTKAKQSDIGDISQLPTGSENVVAEMNELYTMIDNNQSDITNLQTQMGYVETALDNKVDKTEWELLETITADGETESYIRDLVTAYGVSDISAVMLLASYPKNTTSYGIYNSIRFTSDDGNNYSSIFSWTPTQTNKACLHWIVVNKEMGFCCMSKAAMDKTSTATNGIDICGTAVIVKTIDRIVLGTFETGNVTKLIPEGTVFKIYGKGVVRNAEN